MAEIIEAVSKDYAYLAKSLHELEQALQALESSDPYDCTAIGLSLARCLDVLVGATARRLDLIVEHLRDRNTSAAELAGELMIEREELAAMANSLAAVVADMNQQAAAAHEEIFRIGWAFLPAMRWRIQRIEQLVLPMALVLLRAADWAEIEARLGGSDANNEVGEETT